MKNKFYLLIVAILEANVGLSQINVKTGSTLTVNPGTTILTSGDISIEPLGILSNQGSIAFKGNLVNNGTPEISGVLTANGDDIQFIDGADSFAIRNLHVNNASGITLNTRLAITNTLTLNRGVLSSDDVHPLHFTGNSLSPMETVDGYINGTAILDPRYVGQGFSFLGFDVISPVGDDIGMFWLTRKTGTDAVTTIGDEASISVNWQPGNESPNGTNVGAYDISLSWLPVFDNGKDLNSLILYGTSDYTPNEYIMLNNESVQGVKVDEMSEMRSYKRLGLDYIGRKMTLSGRKAITATIPKITITTFPNPATDHISFLVQNVEPWVTDFVVKITDAYGKVFGEYIFPHTGNLITVRDMGHFPVGMYRAFISRGQKTTVVNFYKN